jgi:CHAT domain-containing protein/tetratricopeptide (TPR) repeat protein
MPQHRLRRAHVGAFLLALSATSSFSAVAAPQPTAAPQTRSFPPPNRPAASWEARNQALALFGAQRYAEAEVLLRKALDINRQVLGEKDVNTGESYADLARVVLVENRVSDAEALFEKAIASCDAAGMSIHPVAATAYRDLALSHAARGDFAGAEPLFRKELAINVAISGKRNPDSLKSLGNLGATLVVLKRNIEAEPLLAEAAQTRLEMFGDRDIETAGAFDNMANNFEREGKYASAEAPARTALDIRRKALGEAAPETARSYFSVAQALNEQSRYIDAQPLYQRSFDIRRAALGEKHRDTIESLGGLGENLTEIGRPGDAEQHLQRAHDLAVETLGEKDTETAIIFDQLAKLRAAEERYAEADRLWAAALAIDLALEGENGPHIARLYGNMAQSLIDRGRGTEAEAMVRKGLGSAIAAYGPDHSNVTALNIQLAQALLAQGKYDAVDQIAKQTLGAIEKSGQDQAQHYVLNEIVAQSLIERGRGTDAAPLLRDALALAIAVNGAQHPETANIYDLLATNLAEQGRYDEADGLFRKALEARLKSFGDKSAVTALSHNNIATNMLRQKRFAEAEAGFRRALEIDRSALGDDNRKSADTYSNLGVSVAAQQRDGEAEASLRAALAIRRKALGEGHPDTAASYANLGANLADQRKYAEAIPLIRKALDIRRATLGDTAPVTIGSGQLLAEALATQQQLTEAQQLSAHALAAARTLRAGERVKNPFGGSDLAQARDKYSDPLVSASESYIKIAWIAGVTDAPQANNFELTAFEAAQILTESASGNAMLKASARAAAGSGPLARLIREQQDLTGRLGPLDKRLVASFGAGAGGARQIQSEIDAVKARLNTLDAEIARSYPAYRTVIAPEPLSIAQVQKALAPDEALLLLVAVDGDVFSFVVSKTQAGWHRGGGETKIAAQIGHLRCQVDTDACPSDSADAPISEDEGHSRHFDLTTAYSLYDELIRPSDKILAGAKRLYVATSGSVADLPLSVLLTAPPPAGSDDSDSQSFQRAAWLSDRFAISYLPIVAGLTLPSPQRPAKARQIFEGYGDPKLAPSSSPGCKRSVESPFASTAPGETALADPSRLRQICGLRHAGAELKAMAARLNAPPSAVHLSTAATETAVKRDPALSRANIIAFSTHGALEGEGLRYGLGFSEPGLLLSPPARATEEDDGVLTASEAAQLSLSADWVILSACNTASAQGSNGADGLSALARGFLYAGARALLASHWRVDDEATSALMIETVSLRAAHPELSRAQALQLAARHVRMGQREDGSAVPGFNANWAHPAAWAPFTEIANHDD